MTKRDDIDDSNNQPQYLRAVNYLCISPCPYHNNGKFQVKTHEAYCVSCSKKIPIIPGNLNPRPQRVKEDGKVENMV